MSDWTIEIVTGSMPNVVVRLNDGRKRLPKSRQGRPKVAHGFNRGLPVEIRQSPGRRRAEAALWRAAKAGGAKERIGVDRRVLSSLTGLVSYSRHNPAMNRWAIFEHPCGTWNHDKVSEPSGEAAGFPK